MYEPVPNSDPPKAKGEYPATTDLLISQFGGTRVVDALAADDFETLRDTLAKRFGPVCLGNEIQKVRTLFKYGYDSGLIDRPVRYGPQFKKPSASVMRRHKPMHSWRVLLLPYIEQYELYKEYNFDEPWDGPNNRKLAERMPRTYAFAGEYRPGNTTANYLAVVGPETIWQGTTGVPMDALKDGWGDTILIMENKGAGVHWMEPRDLSFANMDFTLHKPNGISSRYVNPAIVTADGMVYQLTRKVSPQTLRAMLTIDGGEKVQRDEEPGWHLLLDGRQRPAAQE